MDSNYDINRVLTDVLLQEETSTAEEETSTAEEETSMGEAGEKVEISKSNDIDSSRE